MGLDSDFYRVKEIDEKVNELSPRRKSIEEYLEKNHIDRLILSDVADILEGTSLNAERLYTWLYDEAVAFALDEVMKKRNKRYFEVKKEELLKKSSKIQNGSLDGEYIRKEERDEQLYSKEPDSSQVQSTLSNDDTDVQLKKKELLERELEALRLSIKEAEKEREEIRKARIRGYWSISLLLFIYKRKKGFHDKQCRCCLYSYSFL